MTYGVSLFVVKLASTMSKTALQKTPSFASDPKTKIMRECQALQKHVCQFLKRFHSRHSRKARGSVKVELCMIIIIIIIVAALFYR